MTQVCVESTYFYAQHIFIAANNSSEAWHTKATLWAIWVNPKAWAHLAALQFPSPGGFGRRPKGMLDTYHLLPFLQDTLHGVGQVVHLPPP